MSAYKWPKGMFLPILVVIAVMLIFTISVIAAAPGGGVLDGKNPLGADDGSLDVGTEHVADAPPLGAGGGDLPLCRVSAQNFYNRMRGAGYTGADSFIWANQLAWETDWKRAALGGSENSYVDNVDIAYYCDHGNTGSVYFPWDHTDNWLVPNDCRGSWGDKDNEWIAFGTCLTMTDRQGWANCMNGTHLIAGYTTVSYDADEGGTWADQMLGSKITLPFIGDIWLRAPKTVTQAWFTMCDITQPSSVQARVVAEDARHFNDKVWNRGGPAYGDVVDAYYSWMDHNCYKPAPKQVDTTILSALPAYEVLQRTVDQGYANSIATSLGLAGTPSPAGDGFVLTDNTTGSVTRTLEIDTASGGYVMQNTSQLWSPPEPGQPNPLPSPEEAGQLAAGFLDAHQALPGVNNVDAATQHAETERVNDTAKGSVLAPVQSQGVDVMVAYGRSLGAGVLMANGAELEISVAGPGASTKLYMGGQSATRGPLANQPIGVIGGMRNVQGTGRTIQLSTADKAWNDFQADHGLALATIPLDADQIVRKSETLAYYEQAHGVPQVEMIPVWVFRADFMNQGQTLATDVMVYVPASPDYYPPEVVIETPANDTTVPASKSITFKASATGGFAPFTYLWTSSTGVVLGNQATVDAGLVPAWHPGETGVSQQTISVKVTNTNGQSRTESIAINVLPPVYLPMLQRR